MFNCLSGRSCATIFVSAVIFLGTPGLMSEIAASPIGMGVMPGQIVMGKRHLHAPQSNKSLFIENIFYVSNDGSDSNPGTSQEPWQTIMHAIRNTQPGDTIVIKQGDIAFDEWIEIRDGEGGAPDAYKTIRSEAGEEAVINGIVQISAPYLRLESIKVIWKNPGQRSAIDVTGDNISIIGCDISGPGYWSGIYVSGNDVLIENNEVHDFGHGPDNSQSNLDHGIYVAEGNRITLLNNRVHHNTAYGIHVYDHSSDGIDDLVVEGNLVYENGNKSWHKGILVSGDGGNVKNILIHHNIVWGHNEAGMIIHGSGVNAEIYNNTIFEDGKTGIVVYDVNSLKIKNNLIYHTSTAFDIDNITHSAAEIDYNGIYPEVFIDWFGSSISHSEFVSLGFGTHDVLADPQFVDVAQRNFHLEPTSPAINAGIDVGLSFAGTAPDLGAFEFDDATTDVDDSEHQPVKFDLQQNYPNPFNPETLIIYEVSTYSYIKIIIYDVNGRELTNLVNELKAPGVYTVSWNGRNALGIGVASGVYLYKIEVLTEGTDNYFSKTKKMILLH